MKFHLRVVTVTGRYDCEQSEEEQEVEKKETLALMR
jgi:hypothetical protein